MEPIALVTNITKSQVYVPSVSTVSTGSDIKSV